MTVRGIYAIWWREMITFWRETPRIISAIINPILWLFLFGAGLSAAVSVSGIDYQKYIFPGILTQTFLFSSIFYGAYLVWDKRIDLLKSVLVSPLSRSSIFFGKVLGGVTISMVEGAIVLVLGIFLGIPYTPLSFIYALLIVALASAAFTAAGLAIGSFMESPEGFQLITSFVLFPLFFLSGALYPLNDLPPYLQFFTSINPVTYIVDILRGVLLSVQYFSTVQNLIAIVAIVAVTNAVGIWAFSRMRA